MSKNDLMYSRSIKTNLRESIGKIRCSLSIVSNNNNSRIIAVARLLKSDAHLDRDLSNQCAKSTISQLTSQAYTISAHPQCLAQVPLNHTLSTFTVPGKIFMNHTLTVPGIIPLNHHTHLHTFSTVHVPNTSLLPSTSRVPALKSYYLTPDGESQPNHSA